MDNIEFLTAMQAAVRKALVEEANKEIKKQVHRFECAMGKAKSEAIGNIINGMQIAASREPLSGDCVIQIVLRNGGCSNG